MKKSSALALVAFVSTAGAVACSSSSNNTTGTTSSTASGGATTTSSSSTTTTSAAMGPGAGLLCTSSGKNAWETYGAPTNGMAFVTVNENIFANVLAELGTDAGASGLGSSFGVIGTSGHDDLPTFKGKLAALLVWAYGGPTSITYTDGKTYQGNNQNLAAEHTGLGITMDQYNYFVTNVIVPALTTSPSNTANPMVPSGDVSSCFAPLVMNSAIVSQIVGH